MDGELFGRYDSRAGDLLDRAPVNPPRRRLPPIVVRRSPYGQMVGRHAEADQTRALLRDGLPKAIGIVGSTGSGKTEFLTRLASISDGAFGDGTIFLQARARPAPDLLAAIYDAAHEDGDPRRRPAGEALLDGIRDLRLLLLFDDLDAARDLEGLRLALPRATIVFTARERFEELEVAWVGFGGLATADAAVLLQRAHDPFVIPEQTAAAVVRGLAANPGRLLQAPASGLSPAELAARIESVAGFDDHRLRQLNAAVGPNERPTLIALARFGELALAGRPPANGLVKGGFVEYSSGGWSVATGLRQRLATEEIATHLLVELLSPIVGNRERLQQQDPAILSIAAYGIVDLAARGELTATIALGRPVADALAVHGVWGAWGLLVRAIASAAIDAGDATNQAWALHQIGTRAACSGDQRAAKSALMRALELRESTLDAEGIALTQRNLRTLSAVSAAGAAAVSPPAAVAAPAPAAAAAPAPKPRPIANPAAGLGTLLRPLSIAVIAATIIIGFTLGRWAMGLVAQPRAVQTAAPTTAAIAAVTLAPPTRAAPHRVAVRTAPTPRPTNPPSPQPTVTNATAAAAPTAAPPRVESRPSAKPRIAGVKPKEPVATPPAQPAAMPAIQRFSATPSTIIAGDISTICVRVADAHKVVVSHLGRFNPAVLGCREVRPSATTVYTVSAINRDGHGTTQSVRLTVKPLSALSRTAQAPSPTP